MPPETLAATRDAIDGLDEELVALLARRQALVRHAGTFKRDADAVRAPDRRRAMMEDRRRWATAAGLDAAVLEAVFAAMVDAFVALELREHEARG